MNSFEHSDDKVSRAGGLDTTISLGVNSLMVIFSLLTSIAIARALGAGGKGILAIISTITGQAVLIASLGVESAIIHFVGKGSYSARQAGPSALGLALVVGSIAASVGILVLQLLFDEKIPNSLVPFAWLSLFSIPLMLVTNNLRALLVAVGRVVEGTILIGFSGLLSLSSAALILVADWDIRLLLTLNLIGVALVTLATIAMTRHFKLLGGPASKPRKVTKSLVGYGLRGHLGNLLLSFGYRIDVFMAAALVPVSSLGVYTISVTAAEMLWILPRVMGAIISQRAATLSSEKAAGITALVTRLSALTLALGALALALCAGVLVRFLYGDGFSDAVVPLLILLPGTWAFAIYKMLMSDLEGRGYPMHKSITAALAVVVALAIGPIAISRLGIQGAALTSTISYLVGAVGGVVAYKRVTGVGPKSLFVARRGDIRTLQASLRNALGILKGKALPSAGSPQDLSDPP